MKQKNGMLWLLVAALLASDVFLLTALRQKEAAQISLAAEKVRADDLQAQLDALKNADAGSQDAEIARLRADNQDLPRLRNEVTQLQVANQKLQAANQKLSQQLNATTDYARQQQAQLQEIAVENQQARAAQQQAAEAQAVAERNICINHLRQIDAAKQQWALENNKTADDIPTAQDIAPYIKLDANGNIPGCPSGGTYTIGAVGVPPTCSIPGHVLR